MDVTARSIVSLLRGTRAEGGQTMVEFALALPILALLLIAIVQLGLVLNAYVEVTDAARVGARTASVSREDESGVDTAITAARESTSLDDSKLDVEVTPQPWTRGSPVKVRVTYPVSIDILGFVVKSGELEAEATARTQ